MITLTSGVFIKTSLLTPQSSTLARVVVSTASRFVEQTWTAAVRAALIQSSFPQRSCHIPGS
jgi:hypothetical protein